MIVECQDCGPPLRPEDLVEVERQLDCTLPECYKTYLLRHNGGVFRPRAVYPGESADDSSSVQELYGINVKSDLLWHVSCLQERIHKNLMPIATAPCGDVYCVAVRGPGYGAIYWWDHEGDPPDSMENTLWVAPDFETLVTGLIPDSRYPFDEYKSQICQAIAQHDDERFENLLATCGDIDAPHDDGKTMLMVAIASYNLHAVRTLLRRGADLSRQDNYGARAVLEAIRVHSRDSLELLFQYGADPNGLDVDGRPLLYYAANIGSNESMRALISHGADASARLSTGLTILQRFPYLFANDPSLRKFVIAAGAIPLDDDRNKQA